MMGIICAWCPTQMSPVAGILHKLPRCGGGALRTLIPPFPPAIVLTNGSTVWYLHSLRYHLIKRFSLLDFFWYFTWWAPEVQCESSSQLIKQFTTSYLGCCLFLPFITFLLCLLYNSIDRAWNKPHYTCRWPLPDLPQVKAIHTDTGNAATAVE